MEKVFVTGSMGFLGSEIVRQMQLAGYSCVPSDHPAKIPPERWDVIGFDILDPDQIRGRLQGCSVVIHAAGLAHVFDTQKAKEAPFKAINVDGTLNVAREALHAGVKHFVFISSVSVYGAKSSSFRNEASPCHPVTEYAKSKYEAEIRLKELAQNSPMRVTILRLATLYGKGDPGNVARLVRTILDGKFIWIGKGKNMKSLIHVADAARACIFSIERPGNQIEVFNVSDMPRKMCDIVSIIHKTAGRQMPRWHISSRLCRVGGRWLEKFLSHIGGCRKNFLTTLEKWMADDSYDNSLFMKNSSFCCSVPFERGISEEINDLCEK